MDLVTEYEKVGDTEKPSQVVSVVLDAIHILLGKNVNRLKVPGNTNVGNIDTVFFSYDLKSEKDYFFLTEIRNGETFYRDLLQFSLEDINDINEETLELLEPYLNLKTRNGYPLIDPANRAHIA